MDKKVFQWMTMVSLVLLVISIIVGVSLIVKNEPIKSDLLSKKTNNDAWKLLDGDSQILHSMRVLLLPNDLSFEEQWSVYEHLNNFDDKFLEIYSSNEDQFKLVLEGEISIEGLLVEFDNELFDYVNYWWDFGFFCFFISISSFIVLFFSGFYLWLHRDIEKTKERILAATEAKMKEILESAKTNDIK